jgi:hypothetical protein
MTHNEAEAWREFYRANPFDDFHRFYRPAALVAAASSDGKVRERLEWLAPSELMNGSNAEEAEVIEERGYSAADVSTLRALGMKPPRSI